MISQREVNQLRSLLSKVTLTQRSKPPKKRRKNVTQSQLPNLPAAITPRRSKRASGTGISGSREGEVRIKRNELLVSLDLDDTKTEQFFVVPLKPTANNLPWLFGLTRSFDQVIWHSAVLTYRPCVGTNSSGIIVIGMDWNFSSNKDSMTRTHIQSCTPVTETPVYAPTRLVLPRSRLQSRKSYNTNATDNDASPGQILAYMRAGKGIMCGDLWMEYDVTLMGTQA